MSNSHQIKDKLFQDWWQLLQSFDINQAAAEKTFTQIVESYSSPNRYYHTLEHIDRVLEVIQTLESQTQNLETKSVQFAAWFHDIVYDTSSKDNEEKSGDRAVKVLSSLSIPSNVIKNVKSLILATKNHQAKTCVTRSVKPPAYRNAQVLLDADLAILASNPDGYSKYTQEAIVKNTSGSRKQNTLQLENEYCKNSYSAKIFTLLH